MTLKCCIIFETLNRKSYEGNTKSFLAENISEDLENTSETSKLQKGVHKE